MSAVHHQEPNEDFYSQVHRLVVDQLYGNESDKLIAGSELSCLLQDNPEAQREYLNYVQDVASLRWVLCGHENDENTPITKNTRIRQSFDFTFNRSWISGIAFMLAALLLLSLTIGHSTFPWFLSDQASSSPQEIANSEKGMLTLELTKEPGGEVATTHTNVVEVATVSSLLKAEWNESSIQPGLLSRMSVGDQISLSHGTVELTFDRGAQISVFGPAEIEILTPTSIACLSGRATALVGEHGKGFTIETPQAKVVDLGTHFGVNISADGNTDVVVFDGVVDLTPAKQPQMKDPRRLLQGDGLRIDDSGEMRRLMAVQRSDFIRSGAFPSFLPRTASPLIVDVRDNIRSGGSSKCYQIVHGTFGEDALCFVDRKHHWNGLDEFGIPEYLLGADYVMPFNDDKFIANLKVELLISRPATCYVLFDNNMPVPMWIKDNFEDTGDDIGLDGSKTKWHPRHRLGTGPGESIDFTFSVWRQKIRHAGTVVFGGVEPPKPEERPRGFNMYGIAVAAR